MAKEAYVTSNKQVPMLILEIPYNKEFISELRKRIPSDDMFWDSDSKAWYVDKKYLHIVKALLIDHFDSAFIMEGNICTNLHTGEMM